MLGPALFLIMFSLSARTVRCIKCHKVFCPFLNSKYDTFIGAK